MNAKTTSAISDQCMIEENPLEHPAVEAWLKLESSNRRPSTVIALYDAKSARKKHKTKKKSAVYRLVGTKSPAPEIVAKRCKPETAKLERMIYGTLLPQLPVSSLKFYGSVNVEDAHWLFLEYAHGVEWRLKNKTHRDLATQWLAQMHGSSSELASIAQLPDRGPYYYRSQLESARTRIMSVGSSPVLRAPDFQVLERFTSQADIVDSRWAEIAEFCKKFPTSLVHNDFVRKNIHVRNSDNGYILLPFDWEMSGRGVPAVDIHWMFSKGQHGALDRYSELLPKTYPAIRPRQFERLAALGAVFRVLDAVEWASHTLTSSYPYKSIPLIRTYTERLKTAYAALAWS